MTEQYRRAMFRRMHNALKTPHHRRLARNELEPAVGHGMRQVMWLGSRMNETFLVARVVSDV